jgi:hypothetical protein
MARLSPSLQGTSHNIMFNSSSYKHIAIALHFNLPILNLQPLNPPKLSCIMCH